MEIGVGGLFQGVGLGDVAEGAQPGEEITGAVDRRTEQALVDFPVAALGEGFHCALPLVGNAQLFVPVGIGDHIAVGKVGVAAQLMAFLQNDDLFPGLSGTDGGYQAGAGSHYHDVAVKMDGIVLRDNSRSFGHLMTGTGMTYLGAETALDAFILVDLIFGSHKVDGLHGTVAGAIVAAGA